MRKGIIPWLKSLVFDIGQWTDRRLWGPTTVGGDRPAAGVEVNESIALTQSMVWAATRLLCGTGGSLPLPLYRRRDVTVGGLKREGREKVRGHALNRVLGWMANPQMTSGNFRRIMWHYAINWGNAVALKVLDDRTGEVDSLWPLQPWLVRPAHVDGNFVWRYQKPDGGTRDYKPSEVFHIPNIITVDGVIGLGTIQAAREAISMGLATERYGANWFGGDGIPRVWLETGPSWDDDKRRNFRKEMKEIYGGPDGSRVAVIGGGSKLHALTIAPEDSQFLATREFNAEEIARFYGIFPHLLQRMVSVTFNNVEHLPIDFVRFTMLPHLTAWEEAVRTQLIREEDTDEYFVKHNVNGLLRGDSKARAEYLKAMLSAGIITRNEAREYEDLDPVDGGDVFLVQGATVPLDEDGFPVSDFTGNTEDATTDDPAKTEEAPPADDPKENPAVKTAVRKMVASSLERMTVKEAKAAERASAKPTAFLTWLDEFYPKHRDQLAESLAAPLEVIGADPALIAAAWCEQSRAALLDVAGSATAQELASKVQTEIGEWKIRRIESTLKELLA